MQKKKIFFFRDLQESTKGSLQFQWPTMMTSLFSLVPPTTGGVDRNTHTPMKQPAAANTHDDQNTPLYNIPLDSQSEQRAEIQSPI